MPFIIIVFFQSLYNNNIRSICSSEIAMFLIHLIYFYFLLQDLVLFLQSCNLEAHLLDHISLDSISDHITLLCLQLVNLLIFFYQALLHTLVCPTKYIDFFLLFLNCFEQGKLLLAV